MATAHHDPDTPPWAADADGYIATLALRAREAEDAARPKTSTGTDTSSSTSRKSAASAAGLSRRQQVDAERVASVPKRKFERQVESDDPPTVSALSEQGKQTPEWVKRMREEGKRPGFAKATRAIGQLREFAEFCTDHDRAREELARASERVQRGRERALGTVHEVSESETARLGG